MDNTLFLVRIDSKYCDYLRKFDDKVPFNYGKKELRPFVGILFSVDNNLYFAPLSSPKEKHQFLKNSLDLLKLDDGKLGVVNFNNMIPVRDGIYTIINFKNTPDSIELSKYYKLLEKQLFFLNSVKDEVFFKSSRLYILYCDNQLPKRVADRCCNYPLLEEKCKLYSES